MNPNAFNNMVPIAPASTTITTPNTNDFHKKKRTRAKRSCDLCRKKKTRCDAVDNQPCSKCRIAKTECLFLVEQKKRGPSTGSYVETLEARLLRMEKLLRNLKKGKNSSGEDMSDENHNSDHRSNSGSPLANCTGNIDEHVEDESDGYDMETGQDHHGFKCPVLLAEAKDEDENALEQGFSKMRISDYQRTRYIGASSGVHFLGDRLLLSGKKHRIPHEPSWFVQKLNDDIDEHVIMKSKEIVSSQLTSTDRYVSNRIEIFEDTPHLTQELADYLVDLYFNQVHVYCPIINKTQFLEEYYFHKPNPPDKYLLFAIITTGTARFLPEVSMTHSFNFTTQELYEIYTITKAKTNKLLNILHKRSMISTVQTLMLLSMFVGHDDDDDEDTSHWFITGMAIRMAQDLGLHRDCSKWDIPPYEIELRKRIWYSAYMMDRWVAAELGRPVSILDHEFDVELPTLYELDTPPSKYTRECTPALILETETALKEKRPVYACFLYMITLSQIAGQVLVGFHSTRAKKYRHENIALLNILDRSLTNWKLSLPNELKWEVAKNNPGVVNTTACILNMACDCVWILLYRPFIKTSEQVPDNTAWAVKALSICTASAASLVVTAERMDYRAFVALPWNMSIYAVFQAAIIFLHNAKGENDFIKEQGKNYLKRCAHLYNRDPYLRTTRVVKVLQQYMASYEIFMDDDYSGWNNNLRSSSSPSVVGNRRKRSEDVFEESTIASAIMPPVVDNNESEVKSMSDVPEIFNPFSTVMNNLNQDLYLSSLTFGYHKNDLNGIMNVPQHSASFTEQAQQQQQQQQQQEQLGQVNNVPLEPILCMSTPTTGGKSNTDQCPSSDGLCGANDYSQCPSFDLMDNGAANSASQGNNDQPHSRQQFDLASLSSQIPIWDLPSGVTWNEWESFLKSSAQ